MRVWYFMYISGHFYPSVLVGGIGRPPGDCPWWSAGHPLAGGGSVPLTLQMYWFRSPGEKVCERTITLLRTKGRCRVLRPLRSLGRTATLVSPASSVFVSLST